MVLWEGITNIQGATNQDSGFHYRKVILAPLFILLLFITIIESFNRFLNPGLIRGFQMLSKKEGNEVLLLIVRELSVTLVSFWNPRPVGEWTWQYWTDWLPSFVLYWFQTAVQHYGQWHVEFTGASIISHAFKHVHEASGSGRQEKSDEMSPIGWWHTARSQFATGSQGASWYLKCWPLLWPGERWGWASWN